MDVRALLGSLVAIDVDENGKTSVRIRMDPDMPVVLIDGDGNAHEIEFVGADSGQAQLHVGAPAVLSHKLTGEPKPDSVAVLNERILQLEARLDSGS